MYAIFSGVLISIAVSLIFWDEQWTAKKLFRYQLVAWSLVCAICFMIKAYQ